MLSDVQASGCTTYEEEQRFAQASQVFLGRIVAEETLKSPLSITKGNNQEDVIAHSLKVLEVFRGDVAATVVFRSSFNPGSRIAGGTYGDWRQGLLGQHWLIIGQRGSCTGSFLVQPDELDSVIARFQAFAAQAPPLFDRDPPTDAVFQAQQLMRLGFFPDAIEILEKQVEAGGPMASWASENLAEARAGWGDKNAAELAYREHLQAYPANADDLTSVNSLMKLGILVYDQGRKDEGLRHLNLAVEVAPSYSGVVWELAKRLDEQFLPREAELVIQNHFEAYCKKEEFDGCIQYAHWQTGDLYARAGRAHLAYPHLKLGIHVDRAAASQLKKVLKVGRSIGRYSDAVAWARQLRDDAKSAGLHPKQLERIDDLLFTLPEVDH